MEWFCAIVERGTVVGMFTARETYDVLQLFFNRQGFTFDMTDTRVHIFRHVYRTCKE